MNAPAMLTDSITGAASTWDALKADARKILDKRAAEGWTFVGLSAHRVGGFREIEITFERRE